MLKLFFVDDDSASHVYHREMAEEAGFAEEDLFFFFHCDKALSHLKTLDSNKSDEDWPAYIFIDLNMPCKSGFDFISELKLHFPLDKIPQLYLVSTTKTISDSVRAEREPLIKGFELKFLEKDFFQSILTKDTKSSTD